MPLSPVWKADPRSHGIPCRGLILHALWNELLASLYRRSLNGLQLISSFSRLGNGHAMSGHHLVCGFRSKVNTHSGKSRTPIPGIPEHLFQ